MAIFVCKRIPRTIYLVTVRLPLRPWYSYAGEVLWTVDELYQKLVATKILCPPNKWRRTVTISSTLNKPLHSLTVIIYYMILNMLAKSQTGPVLTLLWRHFPERSVLKVRKSSGYILWLLVSCLWNLVNILITSQDVWLFQTNLTKLHFDDVQKQTKQANCG